MRALCAVVLCLALAACEGRYETIDEGRLATRITADFPYGTPARALIDALTTAGFRESVAASLRPDALQDCLARRTRGQWQMAGGKVLRVCYGADADGRLTAVEISATTVNI